MRECDEWHIKCVQQQLTDASGSLPVDQACRAYIKVDRLIENNQPISEGNGEAAQYLQFLKNVHKAVENRLVQRVAMATKCPSWKDLPKEKQTAIMDLGFFSPIENNPLPNRMANKIGNTSTASIRRHESLHEPSRTARQGNHTQRTTHSANAPSRVTERHSNERTNFQRNGLRSTAPRLRTASQQSSSRNENPNSAQTGARANSRSRPLVRSNSNLQAPTGPGRSPRPQPAWC